MLYRMGLVMLVLERSVGIVVRTLKSHSESFHLTIRAGTNFQPFLQPCTFLRSFTPGLKAGAAFGVAISFSFLALAGQAQTNPAPILNIGVRSNPLQLSILNAI